MSTGWLWIYIVMLVAGLILTVDALKTHEHCPGGGITYVALFVTVECPAPHREEGRE